MVLGAATVLFWIYAPVLADGAALSSVVYEIIPGFIVCSLAVVIVSLLTAEPTSDLQETFDDMEKVIHS
jgi:SSS family solute:Na+ symporter/sodium/proline symporter